MLTHQEIWNAIDALASKNGLSPSGLAKRAGLDATTFNVSKRRSRGGRMRWPSTESISKILDATGASMEDFVVLVTNRPAGGNGAAQGIPVIGFAQAGQRGFFDDAGFPAGEGWDKADLPTLADPDAYALKVSGDSMLPLYRDGDTVIISPAAGVKTGDRVVVKTRSGEVMAKQLVRRAPDAVELHSFNADFSNLTVPANQIIWMARIIWASQ